MQTFKRYPLWLWAFRYGFSASPFTAILSVLMLVVAALIPAATVLLISSLSSAVGGDNSILPLIILIALVFGAGSAWQQVTHAVSRINAQRINTSAAEMLDYRLTQASAREFNDPDFMQSLRSARQGISEGQVSSQFQAIQNIFAAIITATSLTGALWQLSPHAALASLLAPIPTTLAYAWYGQQESKFWPLASEQIRRTTYLQDQYAYQRTGSELAALGATARLASLAGQHRRKYLGIRQDLEKKSILSDSLAGVLTTVLFAVALLFLYDDSGRNLGAMFAGIAGVVSGISAMAGIGYQIGELMSSLPANRHLRAFIDRKIVPFNRVDDIAVQSIEVSDVQVNYGDLVAVAGVSMQFKRGQFVAIVGENGSGKTSLLKALTNSQTNAHGRLCVNGECLDLATDFDKGYKYSTVPQDYGRYEVSVREFLALGCLETKISDEALWQALEFAEIAEVVRRFPSGLDTTLGVQWGGVDVSGGQWQRLAIARTYLSAADVWILDEPTSAIDALAEEVLFEKFARAAKSRIVVLTSHRLSTLKWADQIYMLQQGKVVEQGTFAELLVPGSSFHAMFESQITAG